MLHYGKSAAARSSASSACSVEELASTAVPHLNEPVSWAVHAHVLRQQALVAAHITADDGLQPAEAQEAVCHMDLQIQMRCLGQGLGFDVG
jgi:hypothetical protein